MAAPGSGMDRFLKDPIRIAAPAAPPAPGNAALATVQPVLLAGVEELLKTVEARRYEDPASAAAASFDPLRFLAEYLMRNNPAPAAAERK